MISFKSCAVGYDTKIVLQIDNLTIPKRSLLPVIGKNGSGKSTLLRALAGIIPSCGIEIQGEFIYQPQKPYIFNTTCEKNILDVMKTPDREKAGKLLSLTGLNGYENKKAQKLSGGEGARLSLARTLANPADIYLIDEPFASIDEVSTLSLADMLRDHCIGINAALLMPVHNITLAARISPDVLFIDSGKARIMPAEAARDIYRKVILEGIGLC
jgi:ABC-type Mn2+/Zn2+ transport system ATPase subunit